MQDQLNPEASPEEEWRAVVGYEGWYEVSNQGRVRRVAKSRPGIVVPYVLKASVSNTGYPMVFLYRHSKWKNTTIHSLLLSAFIGPRPEGFQADHINAVRTDNRLENLRWLPREENETHRGEDIGNSKLREADVHIIRQMQPTVYGEGKKVARVLAARYGIDVSSVYMIWKRVTWSHLS